MKDIKEKRANCPGRILSETKKGDLDAVKQCLKSGALVNFRDVLSRVTPLHIAAGSGNLEMVKLLVSHGADINEWRNDGRVTPVESAAIAGRKDVVQYLLSRGAKTLYSDISDLIEELESYGETEIVRMLLEHSDSSKEKKIE